MKSEIKQGVVTLNSDFNAKPWAGMSLQPTPVKPGEVFNKQTVCESQPQSASGVILKVTPEWAHFGALRLYYQPLPNKYGTLVTPCNFQMRLGGTKDNRYHGFSVVKNRVRSDREGWEVLELPLSNFGAKTGETIKAVYLQCQFNVLAPFRLADISLVRYSGYKIPADVCQPNVTWPEYAELPATLQVDKNPVKIVNGKFVTPDGRRAYLTNANGGENQVKHDTLRFKDGSLRDNFGLYDRKAQGFIYDENLNSCNLSRLGFNSYSSTVSCFDFYDAVGFPYDRRKIVQSGHFNREEDFVAFINNLNAAVYLDITAFPWTIGMPALSKKHKVILEDAITVGKNSWVPYRIIGKGHDIWMKLWETTVKRYLRSGASVQWVELFNEAAFYSYTEDYRAEFVKWLEKRYQTVENMNRRWQSAYSSFAAVSQFKNIRENRGLYFDYDECLGDLMAALVADGQKLVRQLCPGVPATVQPQANYDLTPRAGIYFHKFIPMQDGVNTPTGGGAWTVGTPNSIPRPTEKLVKHTLHYGMAASPLGVDLILAMAGNKMVVDNEMYSNGYRLTREQMRDRFWKDVFAGHDGSTLFSWSRRHWMWNNVQNILRDAERFPWSNLMPFATRPEGLRGILEFTKEMELVREFVLPKPFTAEPPQIAFLYSWDNARWWFWDEQSSNKSGNYHAALRHLHYPLAVVPSHFVMKDAGTLAQYPVLVAGDIRLAEPGMVEILTKYVENGGTLIVGEGTLGETLYGEKIDTAELLGGKVAGRIDAPGVIRPVDGNYDCAAIPGEIICKTSVTDFRPAEKTVYLWADAQNRPVVTCHNLGKGKVFYIGADLIGYSLAKILGGIIARCGIGNDVELRDADTGELAPNVLVSRRFGGGALAYLLHNGDSFPKLIRFKAKTSRPAVFASAPFTGVTYPGTGDNGAFCPAELAEKGMLCALRPGTNLIILTDVPWSKSELAVADEARSRADYGKMLAAAVSAQKKVKTPFTVDAGAVVQIDLRGAANATTRTVVKYGEKRWQGFPFTDEGTRTLGGVPVRIVRWDHNSGKGYVALKSAATPGHPDIVNIRVDKKAKRLFFLHVAGEGADGENLGKYVIRYADGQTAEIPLIIGKTLARLNETVKDNPRLATVFSTSFNTHWHLLEWPNSRPAETITAVDAVAASAAGGTVVLVAISAEE